MAMQARRTNNKEAYSVTFNDVVIIVITAII